MFILGISIYKCMHIYVLSVTVKYIVNWTEGILTSNKELKS